MEMTFEQELMLREFQHRYAILGTDLVMKYREHQTGGDVALPPFMINEQDIMQYVSDKIHEYLEKGVFEEEYQKAWENIKDILPDNYSTLL